MQPEYRSSRCVLYRGNGGAIDDERLGNDGAVCGRYPAAAAVHGIAGSGFAQVSMGIMPLFLVALERVDHLHGNGGGGQRPRLVERPGRV